MTVTVEYEAEEKLDLPYEEIIKNVIEESLDYVECPYDAEVNVLLTDNAGIHQINLDMRGIDNPTDVLSFPMCDFETPSDFSHLEETPEEFIQQFDKSVPIYLLCYTGLHSDDLADILEEMGYEVYSLYGGWGAYMKWKFENYVKEAQAENELSGEERVKEIERSKCIRKGRLCSKT